MSDMQRMEMTVARRTDGQIVISTYGTENSWSDVKLTMNDAAATWLLRRLASVLGVPTTEERAVLPANVEHMKKHYPAVFRAFVLEAPQTGSTE